MRYDKYVCVCVRECACNSVHMGKYINEFVRAYEFKSACNPGSMEACSMQRVTEEATYATYYELHFQKFYLWLCSCMAVVLENDMSILPHSNIIYLL